MSAMANVVSSFAGQVEIDPKLPLMGPFYSIFLLTSSSKVKRCEELERALTLFIEVVIKHEINADLRNSTVTNAKILRKAVIATKRAFQNGANLPPDAVGTFQNDYQEVVRIYGANTISQFEEFQKEFKRLWNGKSSSHNSTTEVRSGPATSDDHPNKTLRHKVSSALAATLSKARIAIKSARNASSDGSSEVSSEGPGAASDIENDFFTFETMLANEIQNNNPEGGQPSGEPQSPLTTDEIHPPRGSAEWPKKHRVQLSHAGQFRLIHGRNEMAARRESYNEEEDVSLEPSITSVDAASSTSSLNLRDRNYYLHRTQPFHSSGNVSDSTGTVHSSDIEYREA